MKQTLGQMFRYMKNQSLTNSAKASITRTVRETDTHKDGQARDRQIKADQRWHHQER